MKLNSIFKKNGDMYSVNLIIFKSSASHDILKLLVKHSMKLNIIFSPRRRKKSLKISRRPVVGYRADFY